MTEQEFKRRTRDFGLRTINLVESLPRTQTALIIGRQLLRSGTSVGANYRAACRGRSTADVIAKLSIVEEEADESLYWMDLLAHSGTVEYYQMQELVQEAEEILAMTVASIKTLRNRARPNPKSKI